MPPPADTTTRLHTHAGTHWPMLGTVIDIRVVAAGRADAIRAENIVCDEITRLERCFSVHDRTSLLNRWIVDPTITTGDEFDELLSTALRWQARSGGAFNVNTRRLHDLWARAVSDGRRPRPAELHELATDIADAPYRFDGHLLHQIGDCRGVDLNAIAKGFIVDLASEAAWRVCDLDSLTVSAGGDITHRGAVSLEIGIEDPANGLDNAPPLLTFDLRDAAVATSGSARRGFSVGGEWFSHVLDPRTGQPADASASATVIAANAATADVVATIVSVMAPAEGLAFVDALNSNDSTPPPSTSFGDVSAGPIECWIVDRHGAVHHAGPTR